MPKTDAFIQALENLLFFNTPIGHVGDATGLRGSSAVGNLYLSLHSADPGSGANQGTNEVGYTGYARVPVARTGAGWSRAGDVVSLASTVSFPPCTAGTITATYAGIGTDPTGAGVLLYSGGITPSIAITAGITPQLTNGSTLTEA